MSLLWPIPKTSSSFYYGSANISQDKYDTAVRWNSKYKLRPGEAVFFRNMNEMQNNISNNKGRSEWKDVQSIQLDINTPQIDVIGDQGDYEDLDESDAILYGPRVEAKVYDYTNFTGHFSALDYPYTKGGKKIPPALNECGGHLAIANVDADNKIDAVRLKWRDYDSLKTDCCRCDTTRGVDATLCGSFWGTINTNGYCDELLESYCAKEAEKLKDVETDADIPADYDDKCFCFNWKLMPAFKNQSSDYLIAGQEMLRPECHLTKCIDNGYKTRNMRENMQSCPAIVLCEQAMDTEAGENISMDKVSMTQFCGTDAQTIGVIAENQPTYTPAPTTTTTTGDGSSETTTTTTTTSGTNDSEDSFWTKLQNFFKSDTDGADNTTTTTSPTDDDTLTTIGWYILGIIGVIVVIWLLFKLISPASSQPRPYPYYSPYSPYRFGVKQKGTAKHTKYRKNTKKYKKTYKKNT